MTNAEYAKDILPLYIDTAKTYAQTSVGALAFTVVFKEKILGNQGLIKTTRALKAAWFLYLSTVGLSLTYQWIAVHWIYKLKNDPLGTSGPPYLMGWLSPRLIYGCMLFTFFVGSVFLIISSAEQLKTNTEAPALNRQELSKLSILAKANVKFFTAIGLVLMVLVLGLLLVSGLDVGQE